VSTSEGSPEAAAALAVFATLIADEGNREKFARGGEEELREAGVNTAALPRELVDLLVGFDRAQLDLLADTCDTLVEAGFYVNLPGGGRVCYL
jgi:hypothetical protein